MEMTIMRHISPVAAGLVLSALALASCTTPTSDPGANRLTAAEIKSRVVVDRTTKFEIMELFGGPNEKRVNEDGSEVWFYERISQSSSGRNSFLFIFIAGASSGEAGSSARSFMMTMNFDPSGVLRKYVIRESQY
jgi:hypothetical protein